MNIIFYLPGLKEIKQNKSLKKYIQNVIDGPNVWEDKFYYILTLHYYYALLKSKKKIPVISKLKKIPGYTIITDCFFILHLSEEEKKEYNIIEIRRLRHEEFNTKKIYFNYWDYGYLGNDSPIDITCPNILSNIGSTDILCPLGSISKVCKKKFIKEKIILLDEAHKWILQNKENTNLIGIQLYYKTIEICKILHNRGFKIITFEGRDTNIDFDIPEIQKIKNNGPFKYTEILKLYKSVPLFFNFHQESHGWSVHENLLMGNGIICYDQNFNRLNMVQYKTGIILNLYMSNIICADMIEDYYNQYTEQSAYQIKMWALKYTSADTWCDRLICSLQGKNYI